MQNTHKHPAHESTTVAKTQKMNFKPEVFDFSVYQGEGYRHFSTINISVDGQNVLFLVDSGATTSVLTFNRAQTQRSKLCYYRS